MNRRSFIHTCCGGLVGALLGRGKPSPEAPVNDLASQIPMCEGGLVTRAPISAFEPGEVVFPNHWKRTTLVVDVNSMDVDEMSEFLVEHKEDVRKVLQVKYTRS